MAKGASKVDMDALVERVAARVQQQLQMAAVPPNAAVRGTWNDTTRLKHLLENGAVRVGTNGQAPESPSSIARLIDHTLLKPTATRAQIVTVCEEARRYGFASVCVNSTWIGLAARLLEGSRSMAICVVGFPLGAMSTRAKALETREAIADGAQEIDMVIDIGGLKGGRGGARAAREGDSRDNDAQPRGEDRWLYFVQSGRSRICEDLHRFRWRRGHR
jgi:hypothetical protein